MIYDGCHHRLEDLMVSRELESMAVCIGRFIWKGLERSGRFKRGIWHERLRDEAIR